MLCYVTAQIHVHCDLCFLIMGSSGVQFSLAEINKTRFKVQMHESFFPVDLLMAINFHFVIQCCHESSYLIPPGFFIAEHTGP